MKALLAGAITIWVLVFAPLICATITFDVEKATKQSYSTFLTTLLNEAKDPKLTYHKIPMMPAPQKPPSFLLVELRAAKGISITLALDKNDLYVVGYLDQYQGEYRAHFFPDAPQNAKDKLFKEAKDPLRKKINYESNYRSIENKAGSKRNVGLGIAKLKSFMEGVYGKKIMDTVEAKFLLVAIQMISEATRFKYIENQVLLNFHNGFTPDYKIISIMNEWYKISKAIYKSTNGSITPALALKDANNKDWRVTNVSEIAGDMSLLSYQNGK